MSQGPRSLGLRSQIEQLDLLLGDLEEDLAETTPAEPEAPRPDDPASAKAPRRKPARRPLPEALPLDVVEHPAPCACPPDSPAQMPDDRTDQGGNYWMLFTPGIWKYLHAVLHSVVDV